MKVINVPIEPLPMRYSVDWARWFKQGFRKAGVHCTTMNPLEPTSGKIYTGSFLDVVETNLYKTKQLYRILMTLYNEQDQNEEETTVLFFHDLWNPALTNLAYVRDGLGLKNLKICGCLHAGSYDENDFLYKQGMDRWSRHLERAMFTIADVIFVATPYHKALLIRTRGVDNRKIKVTGFPIFEPETPTVKKENIIVFPHRLDPEKQPYYFDKLHNRLATALPNWKFVYASRETTTKQEYYNLLHRSKIAISFALQETWGIAMQEATLCGCIPIVPDRLSYPGIYPKPFRFTTFDEAVNMVREVGKILERVQVYTPNTLVNKLRSRIISRGKAAIPNMIEAMRTL